MLWAKIVLPLFPEMVAHAKAIVSTSVAEGFGLDFLNPGYLVKVCAVVTYQKLPLIFPSLESN